MTQDQLDHVREFLTSMVSDYAELELSDRDKAAGLYIQVLLQLRLNIRSPKAIR